MKRVLTVLLVICMFLSSTLAVFAAYPDPGSGKTNIFMQNIGTEDATADLVFTTGENGGEVGTVNIDTPIPVKGSKRLLYTTDFPAGVYTGWAGAVELSATQPMATIVNVLWDNTTTSVKAAGTYKGTDAPASTAYIPLLAVRPDLQTSRLTIQNTETTTATVTIQFYNRDGAHVGDKTGVQIAGKSERTFNLDAVPEANFTATSGLGSAYITADAGMKIATVATVHWNYGSDAYSGLPSGDTTLWVPNVFRRMTAGCTPTSASDTHCYSNFNVATIQNVDDTDATVKVEFWRDNGTLSVTLDDTIPAHASHPYNTAIKGTMTQTNYDTMVAALGNNWRGTIKVYSTNGKHLAGVVTYYASSTGVADPEIYNAIPESEATVDTPLSFPAVYRKLANPGGTPPAPTDQWSTTLVQNMTANAGTLAVEFYSSTGTVVPGGPWTVPIPANGLVGLNLKQVVQLPQSALDALGTGFSGAMYVTPSSGLKIIGVTCIFWSGAGRGAAYTGFPVR